MSRLQAAHHYQTAIRDYWHHAKLELISEAHRLEKHVKDGFDDFWGSISVKIIAYLIGLLIAVLFTIVGYNFAMDDTFHNYNRMAVERLQSEKASKEDLRCEAEKIHVELSGLRKDMTADMNDLKKILMQNGVMINEINKNNNKK
jgi:hypothetical protein